MTNLTLMALLGSAMALPTVTIKENGASKTLYMIGGGTGGSGGSTVSVSHNGRGYLATQNGGYNPGMFYHPNLLGGKVEYDVDLSQAGCSCNAALYLVSMPGKDWNGNPDKSSGGDYYCDANKVGGVFCTEIDIMEANTHAWQTTPHKCDPPTDKGHYNNCDGSGKGWMNFHNLNENYGPGRGINTSQPFHVKAEFHQSGGRLTQFCINTSQNGQNVGHCIGDGDVPYGYFDALKGPLSEGMVFAMSNWGSDWNTMKWLDGNTGCGGGCGNPTVHMSNISITTGGATPGPTPGPTPTPTPGNWVYGNACADHNSGLCGNSCNDCAWSWPAGKSWNDPQANCRCKPSEEGQTKE